MEPKTMTVPEAGRTYFDLGRNASYEAARRRGHSHDPDRPLAAGPGDRDGTDFGAGGEVKCLLLGPQRKPSRSLRRQSAAQHTVT